MDGMGWGKSCVFFNWGCSILHCFSDEYIPASVLMSRLRSN